MPEETQTLLAIAHPVQYAMQSYVRIAVVNVWVEIASVAVDYEQS